MNRFLPYARLLRIPNVFTAMADICMAALAVQALPQRWLPFLCVLVGSSCFYCAGMVWNDYFDLEKDRKERGFRPLPSGAVSLSAARNLGLGLMAAGLALCVIADLGPDGFRYRSTFIAILLVAAILSYDALLKRTWAGPIAMGACRFLNVLLGLSAAAEAAPMYGWGLALVVGLYIVGVTWFARTEASASNPTHLIVGASIMLSALVLGLTLPTMVQETDPGRFPPLVFPYLVFGLALFLSAALLPAIQRPLPRFVQPAVKRSVLGLIFLDAILASAAAGYGGLAIMVLSLPAFFLGRWVYST